MQCTSYSSIFCNEAYAAFGSECVPLESPWHIVAELLAPILKLWELVYEQSHTFPIMDC